MSRSPCRGVRTRAGHDLPGAAREDQVIRLSESPQSGGWQKGAPTLLPQQVHSSKRHSSIYENVKDFFYRILNYYYYYYYYYYYCYYYYHYYYYYYDLLFLLLLL